MIKKLLLYPKDGKTNLYAKNLKETLSKEFNIISQSSYYNFIRKKLSNRVDIIRLNWFENINSKNKLKNYAIYLLKNLVLIKILN